MRDIGFQTSISQPQDCTLLKDRRRLCSMEFRRVAASRQAELGSEAFLAEILEHGGDPMAHGYMRKACPRCDACTPIRVLLQEFAESSEHRRVLRRNADLAFTVHDGLPVLAADGSDEYSRLFRVYQNTRFGTWLEAVDAAGYLADKAHYPGQPVRIEARDADGTLRGVNMLQAASTSAYEDCGFYDLTRLKTSLGNALTLKAMTALKSRGIVHHHLGSWIAVQSPYTWKAGFFPLELRNAKGVWVRHDKDSISAIRAAAPQL